MKSALDLGAGKFAVNRAAMALLLGVVAETITHRVLA